MDWSRGNLLGLLLGITLQFLATLVYAEEKTIIDRRTHPQAQQYAVAFAAQSGRSEHDTGHAFVIWYKEDSQARQSTQQAAGFYPVSGGKKGYDLLFQYSPGKIFDDSKTKRDYVLVVLMDKSDYDVARSVMTKWDDPKKNYGLLLNDCVAFIEEVAQKAGMAIPSRLANMYPEQYLKALKSANAKQISAIATSGTQLYAATIAPTVIANPNKCTADRVHGSYVKSCSDCSIQPRDCLGGACDRLECTCNISLGKAKGTAIFLRVCDECQFWNNRGGLMCGDG